MNDLQVKVNALRELQLSSGAVRSVAYRNHSPRAGSIGKQY